MKKSDFFYELPEHLIAQTPIERRDQSRLLVLHKETGELEHRRFIDVLEYFKPGDCLVLNDTRVIPARLNGVRMGTGGSCELLLLKDLGDNRWECIVFPGKRLKQGARVSFGGGAITGEIMEVLEHGNRIVEFSYDGVFLERLNEVGTMPLPHYIKQRLGDGERYQTVYARTNGSAAAPTAGLHFTPELLEQIAAKGVEIVRLTLHVGLGTFRPVKAENILEHVMHSESYMISEEAAAKINGARARSARIIAAGTTSCRALESAADAEGFVCAGAGETDIFIYPGYKFKMLSGLITNFHLPESTLIMLVSALAGRENVLNAYRSAVEQQYRFFSFGDAMLVL